MPRRTLGLLVTLALAIFVVPLAAEAPLLVKVPRLGVLWFGNPWDRSLLAAFHQDLRELGWVDGQNLRVEFRSALCRVDQLPAQMAELVRLPVDVILATTGPAAMAAQQATRTIPMVMMAGDPMG